MASEVFPRWSGLKAGPSLAWCPWWCRDAGGARRETIRSWRKSQMPLLTFSLQRARALQSTGGRNRLPQSINNVFKAAIKHSSPLCWPLIHCLLQRFEVPHKTSAVLFLFKHTGKYLFTFLFQCNYRSDVGLWHYAVFCTPVFHDVVGFSSVCRRGGASCSSVRRRRCGHKERKSDTCKGRKGSRKGGETIRLQRFTQAEEKVNI